MAQNKKTEIALLLEAYPATKVIQSSGRYVDEKEFKETKLHAYNGTERGVACIVLTDENKIVLVKRSSDKWGSNKWALPGGTVERDEDFVKAIIREIKEECGIDIKIVNLAIIKKELVVSPLNEDIEHVTCFFVGKVIGNQKPKETDEDKSKGIMVGTFSIAELPKEMFSGNMEVITDYFNEVSKSKR